jgi:hypothetical protein
MFSEYDAAGTTVVRRRHTDYRLDTIFLARRIIGLPAMEILYDGGNVIQAKTQFDENGNFESEEMGFVGLPGGLRTNALHDPSR